MPNEGKGCLRTQCNEVCLPERNRALIRCIFTCWWWRRRSWLCEQSFSSRRTKPYFTINWFIFVIEINLKEFGRTILAFADWSDGFRCLSLYRVSQKSPLEVKIFWNRALCYILLRTQKCVYLYRHNDFSEIIVWFSCPKMRQFSIFLRNHSIRRHLRHWYDLA